jgi:hypothetical protein
MEGMSKRLRLTLIDLWRPSGGGDGRFQFFHEDSSEKQEDEDVDRPQNHGSGPNEWDGSSAGCAIRPTP